MPEQGAHERGTGPARFSSQRIEEGQQLVSELERGTAYGLDIRSECPWFLGDGSEVGMVPEERGQRGQLHPTHQKFRCGVVQESAGIGATDRKSAEAQIEEHLDGIAQVIPVRGIVAGPDDGMALAAGVGGAGDDEGTLPGFGAECAFAGGAGHLHAVEVVDGGMGGRSEIGVVPGVGRQRLVGAREVRRLVHVIPEAGHPVATQCALFLRPPFACGRLEEIGEPRASRPDFAQEIRPVIGRADEGLSLNAPAQYREPRIILHPGIHNGHHLEAVAGQVPDQATRLGKALPEGEHPVLIHVMDVQVEDIAGELALPELLGHGADLLGGFVAVPGLVVSEGPARRHGNPPGQSRVEPVHFGGIRSGEQIEIDGTTRGGELPEVGPGLAHVPGLAMGIVPEQTGEPSVPAGECEGDGDVELAQGRMDGGGVTEDVDVPEVTDETAFVEGAGGFTEAVQGFAFGKAKAEAGLVRGESDGVGNRFEQGQPVVFQGPGVGLERPVQFTMRGLKRDVVRVPIQGAIRGGSFEGQDRPGR